MNLTDATYDGQIRQWADRHDLQGSITDLRCAFEDARTLASPPAQKDKWTAVKSMGFGWLINNVTGELIVEELSEDQARQICAAHASLPAKPRAVERASPSATDTKRWRLKRRNGNPGAADWGIIDFGNGRTHKLLWYDAKLIVRRHNQAIDSAMRAEKGDLR